MTHPATLPSFVPSCRLGLGLVLAAPLVPSKTIAADYEPALGTDAATEEVVRLEKFYVSEAHLSAPVGLATKLPLSPRQTPQSLSVIARQLIEDLNLTQVQDVIKQTTGMTVQRFDGAGLFSNYYSRGFQADSVQLDGLTFSNSGNVTEFDTAIYERVEVLRGPAGLFQGAGEPGATINLVRKRALPDLRLQSILSVGSWNDRRGEADATAKLSGSGSIRARVVAAYQKRDDYKEVVGVERHIVYGTVEFDLAPATTLSLGATRQEVDSVIDQGLPAYADGELLDVDRATFIGADWNIQELDSTDTFAELAHALAGGGQLKFAARHLDRFMLYRGARANGAVDRTTGEVAIQNVLYTPDRANDSVDFYLSQPIEFGGRQHHVVIGADWRQHEETSYAAYGVATTQDVFAPNPATPEPGFNLSVSRSRNEQTQSGVYSQLRLKPIAPLTLVGGGRVSWFDVQGVNLLTGATTSDYEANGEFTPYAATVYDLTKLLSAYASYASVFQPQNNLDASGRLLDPRTGVQLEAGLKAEFVDGRLRAHAAAFRINDRNRAIADPTPGVPVNSYLASGEVRSEGGEFELNGQVLPGLELSTGYAYTTAEYLSAAAGTAPGSVYASFTPKHSVTFWSKYQPRAGALENFNFGAGLRTVSSFYSQSGTVRFVAPGYTVLSAQLGYRISRHLHLAFTINNLLDRDYYEKVSGFTRQNFYGEPRNVKFTLNSVW